ncbi:uncharacterized protein A4U43_C10F2050 [Asparagus officinalis]|uniref:Uncharacterized protein n=1 Tax=Asparagus officinalis TaxID=4686 RepID=A0A5P1E004_ASPOF|nr:uncharacterized protein A4U43_C10F2050 [Asparagus officinalis]
MASAFSVKMGVGAARTQERQFYLSSQRRPREPLKISQCALLGDIKICGDQLRFKKEQKMNWADVDIFGRSGFSTLAMLGIEQIASESK